MKRCRICLKSNVKKNIASMQYDENTSYLDLMMFCLNIQISSDTETTQLCMKCFRLLESFYKFKLLALESDKHLRNSKKNESLDDAEVFIMKNEEIKDECIVQEYASFSSLVNIDETETISHQDHVNETLNDDDLDDKQLIQYDIENYDALSNNYKSNGRIKNDKELNKDNKQDCDEVSNNDDEQEVDEVFLNSTLHNNDESEIEIEFERSNVSELDGSDDSKDSDEKLNEVDVESDCEELNIDYNKERKSEDDDDPDFVPDKKELRASMLNKCETCGEYVRNIKHHLWLHQPEEERQYYYCDMCPKKFASERSMMKHQKAKHKPKKICEYCKEAVISLKSHIQAKHKKEFRPYACEYCDYRCHKNSELTIHMQIHANEKPVECDVCSLSFKTNAAWLTHKRKVHDKEKRFMCQFCSKRFSKRFLLEQHVRKHTGERPFACTECDKRYYSTESLRHHKHKHRSTKNFCCETCGKGFYARGSLKAHMIKHSNLKPYACTFCGYKFGRDDNRRTHERNIHLKNMTEVKTSSEPSK